MNTLEEKVKYFEDSMKSMMKEIKNTTSKKGVVYIYDIKKEGEEE